MAWATGPGLLQLAQQVGDAAGDVGERDRREQDQQADDRQVEQQCAQPRAAARQHDRQDDALGGDQGAVAVGPAQALGYGGGGGVHAASDPRPLPRKAKK